MKLACSLLLFLLLGFSLCYANEQKNLGDHFFYSMQYKKAIEQYKNNIESNTSSGYDYFKIAASYWMLKNYAEAKKYLVIVRDNHNKIYSESVHRIPAGSMRPTLIIGDHIFSDNEYYTVNEVNRGDVVVFIAPENKAKLFIKRVIGLPGDKIKIVNKRVHINDEILSEGYVMYSDSQISHDRRDNLNETILPPDSFFVMGDNRNESYDSRFWGPLPKSDIVGKVMLIYASIPTNATSREEELVERRGMAIK